eukprot:CAMPEP_0205914258 /NCGR_PEP_ID=MMETSP1325-20131115/7110_1 /ASSEMBLY_ACC=CAM_ASM_000708 /TAXON_ID=236786 /ORGANISM="Florenciella sp., Strain RCC1007" /LENGTH=83 /DNA_ID=CAMNT_0053281287 /DNA_START=236 /DNA_END=484 /DNA_ORIENTATION=-
MAMCCALTSTWCTRSWVSTVEFDIFSCTAMVPPRTRLPRFRLPPPALPVRESIGTDDVTSGRGGLSVGTAGVKFSSAPPTLAD